MPDEVPMVTSCPLCLSPDEVQSMVTVEIERAIAGGRTAIMICRSCAGAVILAVRQLEEPLLNEAVEAWNRSVGAPAADESVLADPLHPLSEAMTETQAESAQLHEGEEPDDGTSTD